MSTRQNTRTVRRVHAYHCSPYMPTHAKHATHTRQHAHTSHTAHVQVRYTQLTRMHTAHTYSTHTCLSPRAKPTCPVRPTLTPPTCTPPGHRRALALPLPVLSDPPTLGHEVDSSGLTQTEEVGDLYMFQSGPRPRSIYMCKHLGFTSVYSETPVNLDLDLRLHIVCTNCFDSVTPYNVRKNL